MEPVRDIAKTAAVLTASPALASILTTLLGECPRLRVRGFESAAALLEHARAAPVDLLVCDYALADARIADVAAALRSRAAPGRPVHILALTGYVDRAVKIGVAAAGIDEIIIKPASPAHIRERAMALLAERTFDRTVPGAESGSSPADVERTLGASAKIVDLAAWRAAHPVNPHP